MSNAICSFFWARAIHSPTTAAVRAAARLARIHNSGNRSSACPQFADSDSSSSPFGNRPAGTAGATALTTVLKRGVATCQGSLTEAVRLPRYIACATHAGAESHRAFRTYCKSKRGVSRNNVSFVHAPHALDIGPILRALNRIRVELVGEFSLTTRRGSLYGSAQDLSCRRGRQEH